MHTIPANSVGSAMIVGGGVAGIQAALDLANSGFFVHLVESSPAIGGTMSQLDKTFPTNDCSMCILSPKLVECARHPNIKLMTMSEVERVDGEAGAFVVTVREKPRFVDAEKCVACGICAKKCPKKVKDSFNEGLGERKAAYVKYPQAVPLKYLIDGENCIFFKNGKCRACEKFCPTGAIDFEQEEKVHRIEVGAVVLAPGFQAFDPTPLQAYGYGRYPNVVSSLEFERILSASGPFEGHLERPSDRKTPRKIAWLQCVGSRDSHAYAHPYCSGVCCMYAIKEAVIAKEHAKEELDTAIFFMDMRTYGKDFERYYDRARHETGVRFIRSRIHTVDPVRDSDDLRLAYTTELGEMKSEEFDMVVLSVGLEACGAAKKIAGQMGFDLDDYGFAKTSSFTPVATTKPGIFVCGLLQGPKDIPFAVTEASAAASAASICLAGSRGTLVHTRQRPRQRDVAGEEPRIGVFVCNCGINISSVVDVKEVRDYAAGLPDVVYAAENLFTCSQDSQEKMKAIIEEQRLNRVVVAACSPRTHEPIFQDTLGASGLNKYLFEMANIRDQDSWVHSKEPEAATRKAKDLLRMAVARAARLRPLAETPLQINQRGLVVGGGVAGMTAALNMSKQGYEVVLIEIGKELGGQARKVYRTIEGLDVQAFVDDLTKEVRNDEKIQVLTEALIVGFRGYKGNFTTEVLVGPGMYERKIDHGVTIVATGANEYKPTQHMYGSDSRIITQTELDRLIHERPKEVAKWKSAVMVQCVGSRNEENPNCSRICCQTAVKHALDLKELDPDMNVIILYRDMRTYGVLESYYTAARRSGVLFCRFDPDEPPAVSVDEGTRTLDVTFKDHVLLRPIKLYPDAVILSAGTVAAEAGELSSFLKVPRNTEGFFIEAHAKLRPVDFASEGLYLCGMAHGPKLITETIAQAMAAASRAGAFLANKDQTIGGVVARVEQKDCVACLVCVRRCPFGVPRINENVVSEINEALCQGCGICASECPNKAISLSHYSDAQIMIKIDALMTG